MAAKTFGFFCWSLVTTALMLATSGCAIQADRSAAGMMEESGFIAVPRVHVGDSPPFVTPGEYRNCYFSDRDSLYYCRP